jgi:hypothetical protein
LLKTNLTGENIMMGDFGLIISKHVGVNMSYASGLLALIILAGSVLYLLSRSNKSIFSSAEKKELFSIYGDAFVVLVCVIIALILILYAFGIIN